MNVETHTRWYFHFPFLVGRVVSGRFGLQLCFSKPGRLCSRAQVPRMYMQVETRTSTRLHLKRAPGIRSWSLLVGDHGFPSFLFPGSDLFISALSLFLHRCLSEGSCISGTGALVLAGLYSLRNIIHWPGCCLLQWR
eukprot:XP_011247267.1 PREDICTED: uncharacterized protein C17orf62 homolog isoform X1 [Mus musculus]